MGAIQVVWASLLKTMAAIVAYGINGMENCMAIRMWIRLTFKIIWT